MNAHISNLAPPGSRRNGAHRRKMTRLAALAASASLAAIASPAYAQCVEGPPANFTCAGQNVDRASEVFHDIRQRPLRWIISPSSARS
jgi:hypothetical protein